MENNTKEQKIFIISIDPGEKNVGIMLGSTPIQLEKSPTDTFEQFINLVITVINVYVSKALSLDFKGVLIIEDFVLYKHKANVQSFAQMKTSEMIGAIVSYYSAIQEIEIVKQNASQAKVWDNDRLLRLGFLGKSGNSYTCNGGTEIKKHTRDAFRHLVYYTNKNYFNKCITMQKLEEWFIINWLLW